MNNNTKCIFAFILGAAAGSVAAWKLLEHRFEQRFQEEKESMKKVYSEELSDDDSEEENEETIEDPEEDPAYKEVIKKGGYTSYSDIMSRGTSEVKKTVKKSNARVITLEEFDEDDDDYDVITLTHYSDGVLADDRGDIISDTEYVVGPDALKSFGKYDDGDDDTVYVKNDNLKTKYEILRDLDTYSYAMGLEDYIVEEDEAE